MSTTYTNGTVKKKGALTTPPQDYFTVEFADPPPPVTKTYLFGEVTDKQWALLAEAWDKDRGVEATHDAGGALTNLAITKP